MLSKSLFLLAVLSLSAHTVSSIPAPSPSPTPAATLPVLQNRAPTPLPDKTTYFTGVSIPPVTISEHHFTYTPATSTCHPTVLPDKNGYVPPDQCNALYSYYPSFGAAILFSVLFGIVTVAHIIQAFFYKKGFFWVLIMGAGWEFGSYVTRALSTRNQQNVGIATATQLLVLLAPLWINAYLYTLLSRLLHFTLPNTTLFTLRPGLLATLFVLLDIIAFVVQMIGGLMASSSNPPATVRTGLNIYMGGIGLQEGFIGLFAVLVGRWHFKVRRVERTGAAALGPGREGWRKYLFALYAALGLITLRIVFRLVEFHAGTSATSNAILRHEAYLYVFDALPMLAAGAVWNFVHPGAFLRGREAEMPRGEVRRLVGRWCCCCCYGRGKKGRGKGKGEKGGEMDGDTEMMGLRAKRGG